MKDADKIDYLRDLKSKNLVIVDKNDFVFIERSFKWLLESLVSSADKFELKIPNTVAFEDGKPKLFLKNDNDDKVV